jgi:hypothetical protein
MNKNHFVGYGTIASVKAPIPSNNTNRQGDPLFALQAVAVFDCGNVRDPNTGVYSTERREADITFTQMSMKQCELICEKAHIFINGGSIISTDAPQAYPRSKYKILSSDPDRQENVVHPDEIVAFLTQAVTQFDPALDHTQVFDRIRDLIPMTRRRTILRVQSGQWTIMASPKQIASAQVVDFSQFSIDV